MSMDWKSTRLRNSSTASIPAMDPQRLCHRAGRPSNRVGLTPPEVVKSSDIPAKANLHASEVRERVTSRT